MREFFRGWRRKLGAVTLLMACVFMAGWVRSFNERQSTTWHVVGDEVHQLVLKDGLILWDVLVYSPNGSGRQLFAIPCWTIALPLTVLSAWLLLGKPRPPKPPVQQPT